MALQRLSSCLALGPPHDAPRMRQRQCLLRIYLKPDDFGQDSSFLSFTQQQSLEQSFFLPNSHSWSQLSKHSLHLFYNLYLQSLLLRAPSLQLQNQNNAFHYFHSFFCLVPHSGRRPCLGVLCTPAGKFKSHMDQTLSLETCKLTKPYRMASPSSVLITLSTPLPTPVIMSSTLVLATTSAFPAVLVSNLALASIPNTTVLAVPA